MFTLWLICDHFGTDHFCSYLNAKTTHVTLFWHFDVTDFISEMTYIAILLKGLLCQYTVIFTCQTWSYRAWEFVRLCFKRSVIDVAPLPIIPITTFSSEFESRRSKEVLESDPPDLVRISNSESGDRLTGKTEQIETNVIFTPICFTCSSCSLVAKLVL